MPPARIKAQLVWHAARQRIVLFGGDYGGLLTDMWEWNGSVWQQRQVIAPPTRLDPACAYDRARNVIVMFSGDNQVADTWEFDGQTWIQRNPVASPPERRQAAMAFDPTTQRVVMYGGWNSSGRFSDTWTWNGTVWQQHFVMTPPLFRDRPAMVADLARSRVVLFGGSNYDFQTWEWDGAQWHASIPGTPGARSWTSAAFDSVRREVVLQGGTEYYQTSTNQTWIYRTNSLASATAFGAGCAGSVGTPVLANAPYTLPWLGDTMRTRATTVLASLGALFVSSVTPTTPISLAALGMPGCNLLVTADALEFRSANAGAAEWTLAIPNTPSLVGTTFQQQALPLDPAANALGLAASNGLSLQLGVR